MMLLGLHKQSTVFRPLDLLYSDLAVSNLLKDVQKSLTSHLIMSIVSSWKSCQVSASQCRLHAIHFQVILYPWVWGYTICRKTG